MIPRRHRSTRERARLFALHEGRCHLCGERIDGTRQAWDISHAVPLVLGGADDDANALVAHRACHRAHTAAVDLPRIVPLVAKAARARARHTGAKAPARRPLPGSRVSGIKITLHGEAIDRATGRPLRRPHGEPPGEAR